MKYRVSMSKTLRVVVTIDADSPHEAAGEAKRSYGTDGLHVDGVDEDTEGGDGWGIIGRCESCGRYILEGDQYSEDEDGICECVKCCP